MAERTTCRLCSGSGSLGEVLDLGTQCLQGRFPLPGEIVPSYPLRLARCGNCGLLQLTHTVPPAEMFTNYYYRSSVSATMRGHLSRMATDAVWMRPFARSALDIGSNDGFLLSCLALPERVGVDPSDVLVEDGSFERVPGFYPAAVSRRRKFDLIFTAACFYDVDDPVAFAQAIASNLQQDGLWCVEVADAEVMVRTGVYDGICFEHLCYYTEATFSQVCYRAGLQVLRCERNGCNGGSLRFWVTHQSHAWLLLPETISQETLSAFVAKVGEQRARLRNGLDGRGPVHLLGASTKANTMLQFCDLGNRIILASDRDPRKAGRTTPGTNIPIISEEESRALWPATYLVGPWHFRDELVQREAAFLDNGGALLFPFPKVEEVRR